MDLQGTEREPRRFAKLESRSTGRGLKYEHNMCSLVFARTTKLNYNFSLASNMKGCGAFDDVVLQFDKRDGKKKCFFIQMKSKANATVGFSSLLSTSKPDFSLLKYYESYLETKNNFKDNNETPFDGELSDALFVLYTNADVSDELKNMLSDKAREDQMITDAKEILLTNQENGGSILQLKVDGKIYNTLVEKKLKEREKSAKKENENQTEDILVEERDENGNEESTPVYKKELEEEIKEQVEEFLRKLVIMYKQTEEERFDEVVKQELQHHLKLPNEEITLAHEKFQLFFEDWWQKDYFLDSWIKNNPITEVFEHVKAELGRQFLKHRKTDVENLNITFIESALNSATEIIQNNQVVLMYSSGDTTQPTLAKINQLLSDRTNHVIVNLKDLIQKFEYIMIAWKRGLFDILVVDVCEIQGGLDNALAKFQQIVKDDNSSKKKVIFLSVYGRHMNHVKIIRNTFKEMLRVTQDTLKYPELSLETKKTFLDKRVVFQGEAMVLINIADINILDDLDEHSVSLLLSNGIPTIGSDLEDTLKYYIERKLEVSQTVSDKILQENDITFAIDSATSQKLGLSACIIDDWLSNSISKFVLVENSSDFEKLCKAAKKVLWLATDIDRLVWKKCKGCFNIIRHHLISQDVSEWKPMTVLDSDDRMVLLTAEPGMGKSSLLSHLAKETKKTDPGLWVVRININNFTKILEDMKTQGFHEEKAVEMLHVAAGIKNPKGKSLETSLFKKAYVYEGNMAVLIDGIDEVAPLYTQQALEIVRYFYDTEVAKMWVTSRIFMKTKLEEEFGMPSYSLVPFDKQEQELFLVKFWMLTHPDTDEAVLKRLASRIHRLIASQFKDHEMDFMGIPIQSLLLAEISGSFSNPTIENINLYTLYDLYVEKKWDIYLREKMNADTTNVLINHDTNAMYRTFIDNHKAAAVVSFLKGTVLEEIKSSSLINQANAFVQKVQTGIEKTGIIHSVNDAGHAQFMHRTFCEYFVALWIFHNFMCNRPFQIQNDQMFNFNIQSKSENIQPVLRRIFDDEFKVVKTVLERMLAKGFIIHSAILNGNESVFKEALEKHNSVNEEDYGGRTPLHVAASCGNDKFAGMLLDRGADESRCDTLLGMSSLSYAIRSEHWNIVSEILDKRPAFRERELDFTKLRNIPFMMPILRCAHENAHKHLLQYLSEQKGWVLLHSGACIGHIKFTELSLMIGCSVNGTNPEGRTALHIASENNDFPLARVLIMKGCTVNMADNAGTTPLHVAVERQSQAVIQLLLHNGANINAKNDNGLTSLHAASKTGDLETINILLNAGADTNSTDDNGYTPLHFASQHNCYNICQVLLNRGAAVDIPDSDGSSPVHIASREGHSKVVEILLNHSAVVNALDKKMQSPLHLASERGHIQVVRMLLTNAALVNLKDNSDSTPLQLATKHGHVGVRELLLSHGATEEQQEAVPVVEEVTKEQENQKSVLERETVRIAVQVHNEGERFLKKLKKLF